jgi:agmatinase
MKNFNLKTFPFNFLAIENQNFKKAKAIILPFPFDLTSAWTEKKGPRNGPFAIIYASRQLDDEEVILGKKNYFPIFTFDEIELSQNPQLAIEEIKKIVTEILKNDKFPLLLGGSHTISLGGVKAIYKKYPKVSVLQLDAHPDFLKEYAGNEYNHNCVMYKIRELKIPTVQVGIRSIDWQTKEYIKKEKIKTIFQAPKIQREKILNSLTKEVYLTIDLDVFDPSIMPSVENPQPGGLLWYEVLDLIQMVSKKKKIVGADVVELSSTPGLIAPDILAAKLILKIISYILK